VGGSDIVLEMMNDGSLNKLLQDKGIKIAAKK
jgi:hypothetical protein